MPDLIRIAVTVVLALCLVPGAWAQGKGHGNGGGGNGGGGGPGTPAPAIAFALGVDLAVMDADGSNVTVLVANANTETYSDMEPSWSPDGTRIAFHGTLMGPAVYVVDADGSNLTLVTPLHIDAFGGPVWSPVPAADGQEKLLFSDITATGGYELFIVNPDGSGRSQITFTPDVLEWTASWSPDATRFAANSLDFTVPGFEFDCVVFDLDWAGGVASASGATSLVQVAGGPLAGAQNVVGAPDWHPTLDLIVVPVDWDLWVLDLADPLQPFLLAAGPASESQPSWSATGTQVAFRRDGPGKDGIHVINANGSGLSLLQRDLNSALAEQPDWIPLVP